MPLVSTIVNTAAPTLVTTAETVIATVAGITTPRPGSTVTLQYAGVIAAAAGTTGVTLRARSGSLTGSVVGTAFAPAATASANDPLAATFQDTPGELANATYVITAALAGASANSTSTIATVVTTVGTPY